MSDEQDRSFTEVSARLGLWAAREGELAREAALIGALCAARGWPNDVGPTLVNVLREGIELGKAIGREEARRECDSR